MYIIIIIIIISAWLAVRQRPRENYYVTYKYCLHFNSDSMFQSDRHPPPVIHCAAYLNFEDICVVHGESTASMVHHRELCDNYLALGIRLYNLRCSYTVSQFILASPKSCIRSPSCQQLLFPVQWSFILNGLNQKM